MGHRRQGTLPKTTKWRLIVAALPTASDPDTAQQVVAATLEAVRDRFRDVDCDPTVNASFKFLVLLAVAGRTGDVRGTLEQHGVALGGDATPLALAQGLATWTDDQHGSLEYGGLARAAAADALALWHDKHKHDGPDLFGRTPKAEAAWVGLGTGAGFCELSRLYFSKFTERHLRYFLDREASAAVKSVGQRDALDAQLRRDLDRVSKHAFETAEITQSFAAGWFNKNATQGVPTDKQIKGFLSIAFGKLREELRREGLR